MKVQPLYSFIIATKNRPFTIKKTINNLLKQTYKNFEIIVIDDNSDYDYKLQDNIIFIKNKFSGRSSSRNNGIDIAKGDYLIFIDDDDYLETDFLSVINKNITDDIDIFYTDYKKNYLDFIDGKYQIYKTEKLKSKIFDLKDLLKNNFIPLMTAVFKIDILKNIKFDDKIDVLEDWELFLNLAFCNYRFKKVDYFGAIYNIRNDKTNSTFSEFDIFYSTRKYILKKHLKKFEEYSDILNYHNYYLDEFKDRYTDWIKLVENNKLLNLKIKNVEGKEYFLHSKYNPEKESRRIVSLFKIKSNKPIIFLGNGLGYIISETKKKFENSVILIEPDKRIFDMAFNNTYKINADIKFFYGLNLEDLFYLLQKNVEEKSFYLYVFKPMIKIYNNYFNKVVENLKKIYKVEIL